MLEGLLNKKRILMRLVLKTLAELAVDNVLNDVVRIKWRLNSINGRNVFSLFFFHVFRVGYKVSKHLHTVNTLFRMEKIGKNVTFVI